MALGLREKLVGGLLRRRSPRFQSRQLVQRLGHQGLESVKLLREVVHGGRHRRLKLGRFPQRQFGAPRIESTFLYYPKRRKTGRWATLPKQLIVAMRWPPPPSRQQRGVDA